VNQTSAAWLAAAIDGEGSIVFENKRSVRLVVYNTDTRFTRKAARIMGGQHRFHNSGRKPTWRRCWKASLYRAVLVRRVLRAILPHLTVKASLARRALRRLP